MIFFYGMDGVDLSEDNLFLLTHRVINYLLSQIYLIKTSRLNELRQI